MTEVTFKTVDELKDYLSTNDYESTIYFVAPDYVQAIIGMSDDCRLVYSYENMVECLYEDYLQQDIEDPYTAAMEWVDYNIGYMGSKSPIIVNEVPMEGYDLFYDCEGLEEKLNDYADAIIGINGNMEIIVNAEKIDDKQMKYLESLMEEYKDLVILFI